MQGSKPLAIAGVLVMLLAAVAPAAAAASTSADATETTAIDGDVYFSVSPENETTNDTTDENETVDENETDLDGNETDENETSNETFEQSSSAAAMDEFVLKLHQVVANSTNDSSTRAPGLVIASYAVANNPGNAPSWAGPGAANASVNASNGGGPPNGTPAANKSNGGGPPTDAGNAPGGQNDSTDGNETDGDDADSDDGSTAGNGNGNGPKALFGATDDVVRLATPSALDALAGPFDGLK